MEKGIEFWAALAGILSLIVAILALLRDFFEITSSPSGLRDRLKGTSQEQIERIQMRRPQTQVWTFWAQWVLASVLGLTVGGGAAVPVVIATWNTVYSKQPSNEQGYLATFVGALLASAIVGNAAGLGQWLVLRTRIQKVGWWVLASAVGLATGLGAVFGSEATMPEVWRFIWRFSHSLSMERAIAGAMAGTAIGLAQWLVLRKRIQKAGWWVLASAAALAMVGGLSTVVDDVLWHVVRGNIQRGITLGVIVGVVFSGITGFVLVRLLEEQIFPST